MDQTNSTSPVKPVVTQEVNTRKRPTTFSDLPIEIRLKIWRSAVVPHMVWYPKEDVLDTRNLGWDLKLLSRVIAADLRKKDLLPPGSDKTSLALTRVCYESREEIKPLYREIFSRGYHSYDGDKVFKPVVFNPNVDVFTFELKRLWAVIPSDDFQELRYVAIPVAEELMPTSADSPQAGAEVRLGRAILHLLQNCTNLERLCVYLDGPDPEHNWRRDEAEYKEFVRKYLQEFIRHCGPNLNGVNMDGLEEGTQARQELEERWRRTVSVKFLGEVREERGAARASMGI